MRNAKLWSVLLAAVLLCACIAGVLFTGASATDSRIPTATETYVVGTDGDTIHACLEKAAGETWAAGSVLEIQFSGEDSSAFASPNAEAGISGYTLFEVATIFREDDTQLPIIIRGMDEDRAALIKTAQNSYSGTNDYFFENLTMNGGANKKSVGIYAGSGEMVFENCNFNNYLYTYYYGDNMSMDAYEGWDAAKVAANSNEKGLIETGIVFGHGCGDFYEYVPSDVDGAQRLSAVGYVSDETTNPVIYPLRRAKADATTGLTEEQLAAVQAAAPEATFKPGNVVTDAIVKPWDTASYLILDNNKVGNKNDFNYGFAGARKGVSPVREARVEVHSGCVQYLSAGAHNSNYNETYVGDSTVIVRGGTNGSNDVGIRLSNLAMFVGNLTLEIHEDNPEIPTQIDWVQASQSSSASSTVYGDYHFLMTGGTLGRGYSIAKVDSEGNQVVSGGKKQWTYSDGNDGYWGAPLATGSIVNEVQGGKLWAFYGSRYANSYENTTVSTTLPGTGETLTAKVTVHNKISGGEFGGPVVTGPNAALDIQQGTATKAFHAQTKGSSLLGSVCNEITGGTFLKFYTSNSTASATCGDIYNFVSGTAEQYPTFRTHFYGSSATVTVNSVTNVIKGYPHFEAEDGTEMSIFGGCKNGTVENITNYLGGMPVFDDFYGGVSGAAPASGKTDADCEGVAGNIVSTIALDMTESTLGNHYVWGGNGYHTIAGVDGATETKGNTENRVSGSITCNIYSGHFGTFRAESASGKIDNVDITVNVYDGKWSSSFMATNRAVSKGSTAAKDSTVTTNIYDGEFNSFMYMGGQNANNRKFINNIYGGTFTKNYYGGGGVWAKEIVNNIYGGTFGADAAYYGGGSSCGSESITNNIYGGTFGDQHDYMGTDQNPKTASNIYADQTIENHFYGGAFGKNWTYGGHKNGTTGTLTNYFHSGEDNPVRDPENDLYKYFDKDGLTTKAGGTYFRDQVVCGIGYTETSFITNTANSITNTFEGGLFTKDTGAGTNITLHCGMRWGVAGEITNNFIKGIYYRAYGGSDYGFVTGTITNNFGTELAEGEEAPVLNFTNFTYGAGSEGVNIGSKIKAANAATSPTDAQKMWLEVANTYGDDIEAGAENVVNNFYYGTFHQFIAGSYQNNSLSYQSKYGTITNNVNGGTFNPITGESTCFAGGTSRNGIIENGIINNINGGTFNGSFYGGSVGTGEVSCPSITNTINGGEGCESTNKYFYLGNGAPDFTGTVTSTINDFTANKSYVLGGSANNHYQPADADYAVDTTINGGTYCGFWGQGGGNASFLTGNVRTTINGGLFDGYNTVLRNAVAGGTRNGAIYGNVDLVINDGVFAADVVGGIIWGSATTSAKVIDGNVTTTIKGGDFREGIYALCREEDAIDISGTAVVNVEQTAGKVLKLGGYSEISSFASNGDVVAIDAEADIHVVTLTGTLNLKQTEGWQVHDYLTLPAGSQYSVTAAEGVYGEYEADETIRVYGVATLRATGATLLLGERVGIRIFLPKAPVDAMGGAFTYEVSLDEYGVIASGTYDDVVANGYTIITEGIGLGDFGTEVTVSAPIMKDLKLSIAQLAELATTVWTDHWLDYAEALLNFHEVYNLGYENTMSYEEVETTFGAELGEAGVAGANVSLLMSDAAGLRLNVEFPELPTNVKICVNGYQIPEEQVSMDEENLSLSADIFFEHAALADVFTISVESDAGVHMTCTGSIEALAYQLANDLDNEYLSNAQALLVYIQKAVACK